MFWQMASMWQLSVPSTHSSTSARREAGERWAELGQRWAEQGQWNQEPPALQPSCEPEGLGAETPLLCSFTAPLHTALMQLVMGLLWDTVGLFPNSTNRVPTLVEATLGTPTLSRV